MEYNFVKLWCFVYNISYSFLYSYFISFAQYSVLQTVYVHAHKCKGIQNYGNHKVKWCVCSYRYVRLYAVVSTCAELQGFCITLYSLHGDVINAEFGTYEPGDSISSNLYYVLIATLFLRPFYNDPRLCHWICRNKGLNLEPFAYRKNHLTKNLCRFFQILL